MRGADPGQAARHNFSPFRHELGQHAYVLVIDGVNLLHAKLAYFLAPEKLASTFTPALSSRTPLPIAAWPARLAGRSVARRPPLRYWTGLLLCLLCVSHNAHVSFVS